MKKTILALSLAVCTFTSALAQTVSEITLQGTVYTECEVSGGFVGLLMPQPNNVELISIDDGTIDLMVNADGFTVTFGEPELDGPYGIVESYQDLTYTVFLADGDATAGAVTSGATSVLANGVNQVRVYGMVRKLDISPLEVGNWILRIPVTCAQ